MKKKVISAILAGACALSALSFSATAASKDKTVSTAGSVTLKAATSLATPAIKVTVPSAIAAVINPYGVAVNVKGENYGATGIASGTYTIKNYTTESKIKVTASGTVVVPTDKTTKEPSIAVQTGTGTAAKANTKALFAYVMAKATTKGDFTDTTFAAASPLIAEKDIKFTAASCPVFADATKDSKNTKGTPVVIATLPAATSDTTYSYAQFVVAGEISPDSAGKWTTSDKITMNLVLKIEPVA